MAQLRKQGGIPLACGQNEGLAFRFRDLCCGKRSTTRSPMCITGGYTDASRSRAWRRRSMFRSPRRRHGYHNMHLQAGVANGSLVEIHYLAEQLYRGIYDGLPTAENGRLTMPKRRPALTPPPAAVKEHKVVAASRGQGMVNKPRKRGTAKLRLVSNRTEPPRARRFIEQRWLIDNDPRPMASIGISRARSISIAPRT